ncbi:MAG: type II secretion system protein [Planctomycetota bacterium]|jgi:prepilin-type N-terminal cleavage/methylation domain-containing protein
MRPHPRPKSSKAFTLIEILVVVVILGILAGTVIAQFRDVSVDAEQTAFIASGRNFVGAAQRYQLDYGMYPNAASDRLPVGFGDYVTAHQFTGGTPIGGVWDASHDAFGFLGSVSVFFPDPGAIRDDAYMTQIDEKIDDGDLTTGSFRKVANNRFLFVVAY